MKKGPEYMVNIRLLLRKVKVFFAVANYTGGYCAITHSLWARRCYD